MGLLDRLNAILQIFQAHAVTIGFTVAGLMIGVYCIGIMFSHDNSAMANRNRWEGLQRVIICAIIIAGITALIGFARSIGGQLGG